MTGPEDVAGPTAAGENEMARVEADPRARAQIRWGGVVWGLLLALFAGSTLSVLASAERTAAVALWLRTLSPGSAWALAAAVLGLIIVVSALLGGIRASQRRRARPGV